MVVTLRLDNWLANFLGQRFLSMRLTDESLAQAYMQVSVSASTTEQECGKHWVLHGESMEKRTMQEALGAQVMVSCACCCDTESRDLSFSPSSLSWLICASEPLEGWTCSNSFCIWRTRLVPKCARAKPSSLHTGSNSLQGSCQEDVPAHGIKKRKN